MSLIIFGREIDFKISHTHIHLYFQSYHFDHANCFICIEFFIFHISISKAVVYNDKFSLVFLNMKNVIGLYVYDFDSRT